VVFLPGFGTLKTARQRFQLSSYFFWLSGRTLLHWSISLHQLFVKGTIQYIIYTSLFIVWSKLIIKVRSRSLGVVLLSFSTMHCVYILFATILKITIGSFAVKFFFLSFLFGMKMILVYQPSQFLNNFTRLISFVNFISYYYSILL